tara:strand:- start:14715 stop:16073 length:1359 start_codon:yes stop_codon:yes gene_type:complete
MNTQQHHCIRRLINRFIAPFGVACVFFSMSLAVAATSKKQTLPQWPSYQQKKSLNALLSYAHTHNPSLLRLKKMLAVYKHKEQQVAAWPDPMLGVKGTNFPMPSFDPTQTAMSGITYSVSQRFPISGRLSLQKTLASYNTALVKAAMREKEHWLSFALHEALHNLRDLRQALTIEHQLYHLTEQAASVARTKYTVNRAPQQHVFQAQTALSSIRERMVILLSKAQIWQHKLSRVLGHTKTTFYALPPAPQFKTLLTETQVLTRAHKQRGQIQRLHILSKQAKQLLALSKARYWPDLTVELSVRQRFRNPVDTGAPFISLGLKLPIPTLGNSGREGLSKEAMARHQWAQKRIQELHTSYRTQAAILRTRIALYKKQLDIATKHTLPLARQTYRATLQQYQVDKSDFLTLLSNLQTMYIEIRKIQKLRTKRYIALERLHALAGDLSLTHKRRTK